MQDRNHVASVSTTHQVRIIENGLLEIPMLQILSPDGVIQGQDEPTIDESTAQRILETMLFTRILDERMVSAQRQGRISFYLASTGEEAASVASAAAISDQDMIMSQYREQGALAWRGYTPAQFMDQMFSNHNDPNKGRQMPIHYGDKPLNFMTISSPLATQIPQAAGFAYGQKMAGLDAITLCYFGEGAASEGDFHAGLNMAAVLACPVIFLCRNNGYAISTPAEEQFAGDGIASRGIGYGIKTIRVDGNDPLAVYAATAHARDIAIKHACPVLIEAMTYRLAAHSTSDDPSGYRSKKEEANWQRKDPIVRFTAWLKRKGWLDEDSLAKNESAMRQTVLTALKAAEKEPINPIDDLVTDVFDHVPWHLKEQITALKHHIQKYPDAYPKTAERQQ
ncbi:thiamine pyrophosphate-dependent dehydrogenase E1 component subunit alpha [Alteromonas sp. C1M14]|uniref:thiamine pyrophosphate-dependent dehydrogenase E1 component subunit alpha n=1 Tax=Alteromonas sp. C1M14 TaxID=2841567 RepID=UPI001C0848CF|nr:thiamine pyrophosphate-dependent dehydrogenase E1 component subunit alpha [Alteromonas sp. C1M14]